MAACGASENKVRACILCSLMSRVAGRTDRDRTRSYLWCKRLWQTRYLCAARRSGHFERSVVLGGRCRFRRAQSGAHRAHSFGARHARSQVGGVWQEHEMPIDASMGISCSLIAGLSAERRFVVEAGEKFSRCSTRCGARNIPIFAPARLVARVPVSPAPVDARTIAIFDEAEFDVPRIGIRTPTGNFAPPANQLAANPTPFNRALVVNIRRTHTVATDRLNDNRPPITIIVVAFKLGRKCRGRSSSGYRTCRRARRYGWSTGQSARRKQRQRKYAGSFHALKRYLKVHARTK